MSDTAYALLFIGIGVLDGILLTLIYFRIVAWKYKKAHPPRKAQPGSVLWQMEQQWKAIADAMYGPEAKR